MRRSTIVYIILFAIALSAAIFFNNRAETAEVDATPEPTTESIEYLFTSADGLPTRIKVESKAGDILEVERDEENAWVLTKPEEAAADQGVVESAAGQVATIRILDRVPGLAPQDVGLETPEYTLSFEFTSGVERMLEIGVLTPTERGYYARNEGNEILIVSTVSVDSLIDLLTEPPYAPTEITAPPATP